MNKVLVSSLAIVASAQEWTIDDTTTAQQIIGVGAWDMGNDIAAASANNVGGFMERWNGEAWSEESLNGVEVGSLMDSATSDKLTVGVSFFPVVVSTDGGKTYKEASVQGISQNANVFPPGEGNQIGLVGSFRTAEKTPAINGVAHSADLGQTWSVKEVPAGSVRYGSFPSADTWYVTSGMWPTESTEDCHTHKLTSKLSVNKKSSAIEFTPRNSTLSSAEGDASGYWGKISKTTDGGNTWATVFSSAPEDDFYFNSISCSDENTCVAVTEGETTDSFRAYLTTDGGATWANSLADSVPEGMVSMMGAGWYSDTVGWLAGASKTGVQIMGTFFKTEDGGKTYEMAQQLSNCYPIDMDMTIDGHMGLAACISSSGGSATVATLK